MRRGRGTVLKGRNTDFIPREVEKGFKLFHSFKETYITSNIHSNNFFNNHKIESSPHRNKIFASSLIAL